MSSYNAISFFCKMDSFFVNCSNSIETFQGDIGRNNYNFQFGDIFAIQKHIKTIKFMSMTSSKLL